MAELLVEIFSEEIPARMQAHAADDLKRLLGDALKAANLSCDSATAYVTPRRIALGLKEVDLPSTFLAVLLVNAGMQIFLPSTKPLRNQE
jgi:glycyl-tRNA synthetase beta subunit